MRAFVSAFCLVLAGLIAAPAPAASGGPLATLMLGRYECERPGEPAGAPVAEPDWSFSVITSSRYRAGSGEGTYLLTGKTVAMTSGPLNGTRLVRLRGGFLRVMQDGKPGPVRCVLARRSDRH